MADKPCKVNRPKVKTVGVYSNAIQIIPDSGDEVLLDFLLYSQIAAEADVVARLRVNKSFLPALHKRLGEILGVVVASPGAEQPTGTIH